MSPPSSAASAEERRLSGSGVFARLLLISNTSKGLSVGHSPDGWFLIDELLTLEEWIDRQGGERERGEEGGEHVSATEFRRACENKVRDALPESLLSRNIIELNIYRDELAASGFYLGLL